ncbi:MAG: ATP-binding cassette domain-containing protein [Patescibacteria group bacterium]
MLEIKNLKFKYPNNDKTILDKVNLKLEQGKSYALIGPTGEGKSTLALLIAGLLTPTEGEVLYDGASTSHLSSGTLSNSIGFILQDPFLFQGTVLDNIIYANPKYMDNYVFDPYSSSLEVYDNPISNDKLKSRLEEELTQKNLIHLLDRFPQGLLTQVNNLAENISLGQKQIINFVRIILREPKLLILDEATANLDTVTEQILQNILDRLPKSTTKIIIAHRMNTIKNVDKRFQVVGGQVLEL